jgi:hypothetical protein
VCEKDEGAMDADDDWELSPEWAHPPRPVAADRVLFATLDRITILLSLASRCTAWHSLCSVQCYRNNIYARRKWMDAMTSQVMTALETQLNTLDSDTAQRVRRLVFECSVSLDLALLAVQEADRCDHPAKRTPRAKHVAGILAALWR